MSIASDLGRDDGPVLFYERPGYWLSNFSAFAIEYLGMLWPTVEHAYQASKFYDPVLAERIRTARSAHEAYKLARENRASVKAGWDREKLEVMERLLRLKLDQHPYVRRKLRESGSRRLVEDSPVDAYWGRGPDGSGLNHLGRLWMKLRAELREDGSSLHAIGMESRAAQAGKFRIVVMVDSDFYQLGDDMDRLEDAVEIAQGAKGPVQVFDDQGRGRLSS